MSIGGHAVGLLYHRNNNILIRGGVKKQSVLFGCGYLTQQPYHAGDPGVQPVPGYRVCPSLIKANA